MGLACENGLRVQHAADVEIDVRRAQGEAPGDLLRAADGGDHDGDLCFLRDLEDSVVEREKAFFR